MCAVNRQKIKLLVLMEILQRDSDEQNPLTTRELLERLEQQGISCDRRTLSRDMADLNDGGYEVMSVMCGHEKGYYVDDRSFTVPELRILMDAVQASGFITPGKTENLIRKISSLGGSYRAALLHENTVLFNHQKHSNEAVYYTISTLEDAFSLGRQVSFRYFKLDENRQKIYQHEGGRFLAEPVSLVLDSDRYYLAAVTAEREGLTIFRIDRIDDMRLESSPVTSAVEAAKARIPELTRQAFKMYLGPIELVNLEFDDVLMGAVYDQFGEDTRILRIGETRCQTTVEVQVSPTFFGWLLQFGDQMKLTGPDWVLKQVRDFCSRLPY